jgi:hypothetical protein
MIHFNGLAAKLAVGVLTLCFGLVTAAQADSITLTRDTGKYTSSMGGEFAATSFSGATLSSAGSGVLVSGSSLQTFCLEANESVSMGTSYNWTLSTGAVAGGYSGGNPDTISSETAYLFHQFWKGTLSGYTYTQGASRVSSATSLQLALWKLEGELGTTALTNAYNSNLQAQSWVSAAQLAVSSGTWSGLGDVKVLNLTTSSGANAQSMLVEVTTPVSAVPLPPSALLGLGLMAALSGVGVMRQRSRKSLG